MRIILLSITVFSFSLLVTKGQATLWDPMTMGTPEMKARTASQLMAISPNPQFTQSYINSTMGNTGRYQQFYTNPSIYNGNRFGPNPYQSYNWPPYSSYPYGNQR